MMLIAILWATSIIIAILVGYWCRNIVLSIKRLADRLHELELRKKEIKIAKFKKPEAKVTIVDPTDIEQQVKLEQEEIMRQLNPEIYNNDLS